MKKLSPSIVLVKNIHCSVSRTKFSEATIEAGARLILAVEGVVNPILLRREGMEHYVVVDGIFEYYAALRARELDLTRGETINAYIIEPDNEKVLMEQIKLFRTTGISMDHSPPIPQTVSSNALDALHQRLQDLECLLITEISALRQIISTIPRTVPSPAPLLTEKVIVDHVQPLDTTKESVQIPTEETQEKFVLEETKASKKKATGKVKSTPAESVKATQKPSQKVESSTKTTVESRSKSRLSQATSTDEFLNQLNHMNKNELITQLMNTITKGASGMKKEDLIQAILEGRPFQSSKDLERIKGLGKGTLDKIKKNISG